MRIILLIFLIGAASADFLEDAAPVIDDSVLAFLRGSLNAGPLLEALQIHDPEIEQMADDLEQSLGQKVREALKELLDKIKDHVDNGKAVGQELLQKVKDLRKKLKDVGEEDKEKVNEILKKIREQAKEALKKILERLGLGKRNLDDSFDRVARMKFQELVERIKEKILSNETIQKIREYIMSRYGESELVKKMKEFVATLKDRELKEIVSGLLDYPHHQKIERGEAWDKLKDFFKGLNIKIQDHSKKFGEWVKDMWGKGLDKLKEKYGTIKAIAMEFIANSKDMSGEMAREALEFFRPYKDDLGTLWKQIVDASKEAIGRF